MARDERAIQTKIIKNLESQGCYVIKTIACSKAGVPDIIACYKGTFIAIEVKTSTGVVSKLQYAHIRLINNAKGYAIVAKNLADAERLLDKIDENQQCP